MTDRPDPQAGGEEPQATTELLAKSDFLINHMRALVERMTEHVQQSLVAEGFFAPRPAHVNLMAHVPIEGIRPSELAGRMQVTKQAVDQLLDQLEKGGAVTREVDPRDKRARLVKPTAWAIEAFLTAGTILQGIENEWRQLVGDEEFRVVERAFELMRRHPRP